MRKELPRCKEHQSIPESIKASQRASARLQTCRERSGCWRRREMSLVIHAQTKRASRNRLFFDHVRLSQRRDAGVPQAETLLCVSWLHVFVPLLFLVSRVSGSPLSRTWRRTKVRLEDEIVPFFRLLHEADQQSFRKLWKTAACVWKALSVLSG